MKKRILSVLFVIALLVAALMIPAQAETPTNCPCGCGKAISEITWTSWDGATDITASGHYKLTKKATATNEVLTGINVVLDLNGYQLINTKDNQRTFKLTSGAKLYVMSVANTGGKGGEIVSNSQYGGGAVYIDGNSEFYLYSGTLRQYTATTTATSVASGIIHAKSGNVYIYGGTVTGQSYSGVAVTRGGAIYMESGDLTVTGGTINGGYAKSGGTIYIGSGTASITGGTINAGTLDAAADGAGTCIYNNGSLTIGGTANLGTRNADGNGNVFLTGTSTLTLSGTPVVNGILQPNANATFTIGQLSTGAKITLDTLPIELDEANENLKSYVEAEYLVAGDAALALSVADDNKTISGKIPDIYCPHCDTDIAAEQWISWDKSATPTESGHYYIAEGTTAAGQYVTPANTDIVLDLRGNWYTAGIRRAFIVKDGATFSVINTKTNVSAVSGGHSSGPVEVQANSTFKMYPNVTYKQPADSENTMFVTMKDGTFVVAEGTNADHLSGHFRYILGTIEGVEGALLMDANTSNGGIWYKTAQEAADAFVDTDHDFVRMRGAATVKGSVEGLRINNNGHNLTIDPETTVPVEVLNMKSLVTAADLATITADEEDIVPVVPYTIKNGTSILYVAAPNGEGAYTSHRLEMKLTNVTLRPSVMGFYYKAKFNTDDILADKVDTYGVVFSVDNMPGGDFATETGDINRWTAYEGTNFADMRNQTVTSGSIFGIMKNTNSAEKNAQNGMRKIYANAYITFDFGATAMSDNQNAGKTADAEGFTGVAKSLFDLMQAINAMEAAGTLGENAQAIADFKQSVENDMQVQWPAENDTVLTAVPLA